MKTLKDFGWMLAIIVGLSACPITPSAPPPWALGDQPNFSGKIEYWAKGDAIAPGDGGLYGVMYSPGGDPDGDFIGYGSIKADASFTFGLQRGASGAGGGQPAAQVLCGGLSLSSPQQKIAKVDILSVTALYENDKHARPGGGVLISTAHPVPASKPVYTFIHASQDGAIKGSCNIPEVGNVAFDLDLRQGWNSVQWDTSGFKTAAIPSGVKWYFINPNTAVKP